MSESAPTEAAEAAPSVAPRWQGAVAKLVDGVPVWLERYQVPIALFGLASGFASYWFIDRQPALAAGIAMAALAGWALLLLEAFLLSTLPDSRWSRAGTGLFQVTLQAIHQESLFFVVTFALLSTTWESGQVVFTGLIVLLTAVASIDPLYHLTLARSRVALLGFHAVTMFLCGFMALPIAFQAPLDEALLYSMAFTMISTWPLLYRVAEGRRRRRFLVSTAIVAAICGGLFAGRSLLPPMSARVVEPVVTTALDEEEKRPLGAAEVLRAEAWDEDGLYAYTPIRAPLGLNQGVVHEWRQDGALVDRIPMEITGGRREGFRAWSHKENFPENPAGDWEVRVRTPLGIVLGSVRFRVEGKPAS